MPHHNKAPEKGAWRLYPRAKEVQLWYYSSTKPWEQVRLERVEKPISSPAHISWQDHCDQRLQDNQRYRMPCTSGAGTVLEHSLGKLHWIYPSKQQV